MVEQAVLSLTALANMFLELYADCSGYPADSIIEDAVALRHDGRLADGVMWAANMASVAVNWIVAEGRARRALLRPHGSRNLLSACWPRRNPPRN